MGKQKWGSNPKVEEAREREKLKKQQKKQEELEKKERIEWAENDKNVIAKLDRKKEKEEKKQKELELKEEKRKLYEAEQATLVGKNTKPKKVTQQDMEKFQKEDLKRAVAAQMGIDLEEEKQEKKEYLKEKRRKAKEEGGDNDEDNGSEEGEADQNQEYQEDSSDDEYKVKLQDNINHQWREQQEQDNKKYNQVIEAHGIEDAFNQLVVAEKISHPEKKFAQAFELYEAKRMPELKKENPTLKRSQLLQILNKEFKKAPENPYNMVTLAYNEK